MDAELACRMLQMAGLHCVACRSAEHLLSEMENGLAGLLLVEEALTPDFVDRLSRYVSNQPNWSDLPVLLLTAAGACSPALHYPIQALGNLTLLERPIQPLVLISAVGSALRARKRQYAVREAEQKREEFLARLVDDLLDVARISRGKVVLKRAPTDLAAVINHAVELCGALADNAHHEIVVSQPADTVPLIADHARLVQSVAWECRDSTATKSRAASAIIPAAETSC